MKCKKCGAEFEGPANPKNPMYNKCMFCEEFDTLAFTLSYDHDNMTANIQLNEISKESLKLLTKVMDEVIKEGYHNINIIAPNKDATWKISSKKECPRCKNISFRVDGPDMAAFCTECGYPADLNEGGPKSK